MEERVIGWEAEEIKKRGRWFYGWGIFYVIMTYAYPVFWYLTLPKVDESINSEAAYEEAAIAQNGVLGTNLPLVFLLIPFVLAIINLGIVIFEKKLGRKYYLNVSRIIKYSLIPFYLIGGTVIALFILMMFTPVVIMVFITPVVVTVLSVLGYVSVLGCAPFMIKYLIKSVQDKKHGVLFSIVISVMLFIFGWDVFGTIICALFEKKKDVPPSVVPNAPTTEQGESAPEEKREGN